MLEIENLTKNYILKGKSFRANDRISLSVGSGKMIWIRGNSGAGKSTFLNAISGIDDFDSGSIKWDGFDFSGKTKRDLAKFRLENCGLIFQFFELLKTQNAFSNAVLPLKLSRTDRNGVNYVRELFEVFGISGMEKKYPSELSGGERQRVGIIRALSNRPRYLVADEITASLDVNMSKKTYSFLCDYIKKTDGTGIFVSHDYTIADYVDECYEMTDGRLVKCTF